MSIYDIFIMMFYALDAEYEETPNEELRLFLSDVNPFLFKGEESAEPSAYENFKKAYEKYGTDKNGGYDFVSQYIQKECSPTIRKAFSNLSQEEWNEALEEYQKTA